ncbi:D-alanyl-D-alanine carboxypeptidase family protein [Sinorhizobium sp. CB9]
MGLPRLTIHFILSAAILAFAPAASFAGQADLILDARTGQILASENADDLNHPASLTKMMTLYLAFEALHDGKLKWDQRITMSQNADGKDPYKLGVGVGRTVSVREAVYGMIVLSANDAAALIGETLAGSEPAFGEMMTTKARALGMSKTVFKNATGLPDPEQVTTARDMSTLAVALMNDFPEEFKLFSMRNFEFRGMKLRGHNNLMYRYQGVDGIKTGFIDASGYNVVTSAKDGDRRVVGVVMGGKTADSRDAEMAALLDKYMPMASATPTTTLTASQ